MPLPADMELLVGRIPARARLAQCNHVQAKPHSRRE